MSLDTGLGFIEFRSHGLTGLRAFTTLRGFNLGLNTEEAAESVISQRRRLWQRAGIALEASVFMHQVHGAEIATVTQAERGRGSLSLADALQGKDGLVTAAKGTFLCVGHADCLAVLVADPEQGAVGAAHMGWRGAAQGIAAKLVARMQADFGSKPAELWAGLSCCLGPCHLELSAEQHAQFAGTAYSSPLIDGHFKLDLWSAASTMLKTAGLKEERIEAQRYCTIEESQALYSYRGEEGRTGRMMSVIGFV